MLRVRDALCGALLVHLLAAQSPARPAADALVDRLTTFTGGTSAGFVAHEPLRGMALSEQLGWAMRDSYVMRVALPADGALHGLDIRTRRRGLTILAPVAIFSPRTQ